MEIDKTNTNREGEMLTVTKGAMQHGKDIDAYMHTEH